MRKRLTTESSARVADGFYEWIESLPYVRQRSHGLLPSTRMYDVDCDPLDRCVTWLVVDQAGDGSSAYCAALS